jgi:predicted Zn-dependent protease
MVMQPTGSIRHSWREHSAHCDAMDRLKEQQKIERREIGIALLLGPSLAQMRAIQMIGDLHSPAYSRDDESRADVTGSDICAAAGYNPRVWCGFLRNFRTLTPIRPLNFYQTIRQMGQR